MHSIFLKPTLILLIAAVPVWFIARAALRKRTTGIDISWGRETLLFFFYMYLIGLAAITIVPLSFALHRAPEAWDINLVPFRTTFGAIKHTMTARQRFRPSMLLENTPGNILLFIPMGLLLPLISKKNNSFWRILLIGLLSSALIEFIQYIERSFEVYRSVDVDDVILNTLGAIAGWLLYRLLYAFSRIFIPRS